MDPTSSRAITSPLAALGAVIAVSAMIGAPIAVATHMCQPGEVIKSADQCTTVPNDNVTNPDGTSGKILCTQAGHCSYFPNG